MDDNGTYLGNIYGIYKACIANISIDIYDIKYKIITHTDTQWGGRPIGAPPPKAAAPVCLIILYHKYLWIY